MRTEAVLVLAFGMVTAGCVGTVSAGDPAMDPRDSADEAARSWDEDARLVGVFAFEASPDEIARDRNAADTPEEEAEVQRAAESSDGTVADGEAAAWTYDYRAGNLSYEVTVASNGTILEEETGEADDDVPIGGWEVDSDEAADIVAENNETWAEAEDPRSAFYGLYQNATGDNPVWGLGLFARDAPPIVYQVDATTGEYLGADAVRIPSFSIGPIWGSSGGSEADGPPPQEGESFSGTLTATDGVDEEGFTLADDEHPQLVVQLDLDGESTGSTVELTLTTPDGEEETVTVTGGDGPGRLEVDEPVEGGYEVTVELERGVDQDYTVTWCATGSSTGGDAASACRHVDAG